jgi:methylglyoxal synthase
MEVKMREIMREMRSCSNEKKTCIAVLASHDSDKKNNDIARLLDEFKDQNSELLKKFHFIFTGGTFVRVLGYISIPTITPVDGTTKEFLLDECGITRLPSRDKGGVTILANLIVQQKCSIIWPFLDPVTDHWLRPENLALLRLCDQWRVKKLMNKGSVEEWFNKEAEFDIIRNCQNCPPTFSIDKREIEYENQGKYKELKLPDEQKKSDISEWTVALIAHNEMKKRMIEFAIDHEQELVKFKRILTTGTTGREVIANTRNLEKKVHKYQSGPKGGDIEIATEIPFGCCQAVIFFIDPLNPHPHIEDIRTVLGSCMLKDEVRMFTNEMQARDWMQRVIRG